MILYFKKKRKKEFKKRFLYLVSLAQNQGLGSLDFRKGRDPRVRPKKRSKLRKFCITAK